MEIGIRVIAYPHGFQGRRIGSKIPGCPSEQKGSPLGALRLIAKFAVVALVCGSSAAVSSAAALPAAAPAAGPSSHCHVSDGAWTVCPNGSSEWSDVAPTRFAATNSYVYADQADLSPALSSPGSPVDTLMLMYDECARLTRLGPNEFVLVNFDTVEDEDGESELERYTVHVFGDGTLIFFENGHAVAADDGRFRVTEIEGQKAKAGFGPSPQCSTPHVFAEYEIKLTATGLLLNGGYSPDPIFWGADTPPEDPDCPVEPMPTMTDPQAQQIEAPETFSDITIGGETAAGGLTIAAGHPVRVSSRALLDGLTPAMRDSLNDMLTTIVNTPGAGVPQINSAFQPENYQEHLRALRDRATQLGATVNSDGEVAFTNDDHRAADLRDEVAGELRDHGLRNNPVARASDYETGNAVDVSVSLPAGVNIDDIAAQAGLRRPLPNGDPTHFVSAAASQPGPQALPAPIQGSVLVHSPISVLLTDPAGHRIGFGVNEIGESATDSDAAVEPERIDIDQLAPGTYTISGVATGDGPYTFDFVTATSGSKGLDAASISGTAVNGQPITPIVATVGQEGEVTLAEGTAQPVPGVMRPGFDATPLAANDDGSTGPVQIGFPVDFFGTTYSNLFVNNNGNVTFDGPLSTFTPFDLTSTGQVIIAPFFGDVDTRRGAVTRYGPGTVDGRPAFGVTWPGVGCYNQQIAVRNSFQVVLVDRSDLGEGGFDIEFNYDSIQWETGQASGGNALCAGGASARAGFSNGTGAPGTSFELPGSGIPGSLLDSNFVTGLANHAVNSEFTGRYAFPVRNGRPAAGQDSDEDGIADELDNCPRPNPDQRDANLNGVGDACQGGQQHASALFLQAGTDGHTSAEAVDTAMGHEPSLLDRLVRIVSFRLQSGLADDAQELTHDLVHSLVEAGLVDPADADALEHDVLAQVVDTAPPVVTVAFPAPDGDNGWFVSPVVTGTVTATDGSGVTSITCTGAVMGAPSGIGSGTASATLTVSGDGSHTVACSAADAIGNSGAAAGSSAQAVVKIDSTTPSIGCSASPRKLWPPNHGMVDVNLTVTTSDGGSGSPTFTLVSMASSEPDDGLGDGDTSGDLAGWTIGTPDISGQLRAERSGNGPGRVYTLTYLARDAAGNNAACAAAVTVPHNR
jgi:hypothetical protein